MDILDRHDFEQLLSEYSRRGAILAEKLEHFFRVEIPERERLRARGKGPGMYTAPPPGFTADTSEAACAKLAQEISETIRSNHVDGGVAAEDYDHEGVVAYLTDILGEAFAGRMPEIDPAILRFGAARDEVIAESKAKRHARNGKAGAAVRAATTGKKPAKAKARRRWAGLALTLLIAACGAPGDDMMIADDAPSADGSPGDGGFDVDADPNAPDAATPGPDAGPGLPNGAACDPLIAECAAELTCRITSLDPEGGRCQLAGPAFENDPCDRDNGDGDCGHAMACLGNFDPRCYVICDPANPVPRCGDTDTCVRVWGATVDLGACSP